ncbi:uncharacterized protein LOC144115531 isoform X6 [Amblyomma americanum]
MTASFGTSRRTALTFLEITARRVRSRSSSACASCSRSGIVQGAVVYPRRPLVLGHSWGLHLCGATPAAQLQRGSDVPQQPVRCGHVRGAAVDEGLFVPPPAFRAGHLKDCIEQRIAHFPWKCVTITECFYLPVL